MKWPKEIAAGTMCNQLASTIDFLPTFAEMLHVDLPERKIDGVSILSLIKGGKDAKPRDTFYYYYNKNDLEAVRKDQWKLVFPHMHRSYEGVEPGKDGLFGDTRQVKTEMALYDLRRDPGERYNVLSANPEIVEELKNIASIAREDLGDNLQNIQGKNVRIPGKIE
jgi:arylsulfatase